jgi:CubicO group peptidase (beta-lactamase class C family)
LSDEGLQRLGAPFSSALEQNRSAGAVVLVARTGQPAYFEAFGFRDRSRGLPMHRDCVFRIASMTKPVVAAAALLLLEEGRLALIDPIQEYLPEFRDARVGTEIVEPDGRVSLSLAPALRPITVHDLFRHTSGLTTGLFGGSLIRRQYVESRLRDDQQTLAQMIRRLAQLPLLHQPGTTFEYGMSTDVLGRIVEVVSGVDLNRFVIDRISRPLRLADTAFVLDARSNDRLALPHCDPATAQILPAYDFDNPPMLFSGGTGLLSSAADYCRFCQMLLDQGSLDGVRLLSRKSVELMLSDHLPPGIAFGPNTRELGVSAPLPEFGQSYGLGVGIRTHPGLSPVPGSVGDFFWGGALGTYFWVDPREQLTAILMMQELDAAPRARYRSLFRNMVYHALND